MFQMDTAQACSAGYDWFHSCWSVVPSNPQDCAISQIHRHRGNCLFVDTRISGCQGHRGENEIIHSEEDGLYVTLYNEGGLRFLSGNHESTMQAGDILLWDTGMAGSFDCQTAASGRTILFPRKMVERRLGNSGQIDGMRSNRSDPRTILLRSYLEKLHDLAEDTREDILAELLEASLELTYLCVIDKGDLPGTTQTRATFREIRKEIREHVGSDDLTPAAVANRLGMSLRNLQTVLSAHGTTFTALLNGERMKRAAQLLRSPASRRISISEIAFSLGFYDQAHFSNAFRRHYGMSPRRYRNLS
jgi:AraC-like DNA-binding protein